MYGHIKALAEQAVAGAKSTGATVDFYQFPETLSDEILGKMHAGPKDANVPFITPNDMKQYDGFVFAFPTRYGRAVAQVSAFFDATGQLWATGALVGKFATTIVSTASQNGGQETTHLTTVPYFAHHGIIYVPIGYSNQSILSLDSIHGGSPWGASTLAAGDGSRAVSDAEKSLAEYQGKYFANIVNTYVAGKSKATSTTAAPLEVPASAQNPTSETAAAQPATVEKEAGAAGGYNLDQTAAPQAPTEAAKTTGTTTTPATKTTTPAQKTEGPGERSGWKKYLCC